MKTLPTYILCVRFNVGKSRTTAAVTIYERANDKGEVDGQIMCGCLSDTLYASPAHFLIDLMILASLSNPVKSHSS